MTGFAPRPPPLGGGRGGAAVAIALAILASLARPTWGLAGFPNPVHVPAPCVADYVCNQGVCRDGYCVCFNGFYTLNGTKPCWQQRGNYEELMLMTWLGLGALGIPSFVLGWTHWGLAIVLLLAATIALRCRALYLAAQHEHQAELPLLTKAELPTEDAQAEIVGCCAGCAQLAWATLAFAVAVVSSVHCVDARGVPCA